MQLTLMLCGAAQHGGLFTMCYLHATFQIPPDSVSTGMLPPTLWYLKEIKSEEKYRGIVFALIACLHSLTEINPAPPPWLLCYCGNKKKSPFRWKSQLPSEEAGYPFRHVHLQPSPAVLNLHRVSEWLGQL